MKEKAVNFDGARQFLLMATAALVLFFIVQEGSNRDLANVRSITALDAKKLIDDGAIVIDVRGSESYGSRHIPGAISVPLDSLRAQIPAVIAREKTRPIVVYCGDGVTMGPKGTALLNNAGYANAVNLGPGIQGWADAGYSVVKAAPGA